jgi:hypothetical protein
VQDLRRDDLVARRIDLDDSQLDDLVAGSIDPDDLRLADLVAEIIDPDDAGLAHAIAEVVGLDDPRLRDFVTGIVDADDLLLVTVSAYAAGIVAVAAAPMASMAARMILFEIVTILRFSASTVRRGSDQHDVRDHLSMNVFHRK